jgi:hypothetical protein
MMIQKRFQLKRKNIAIVQYIIEGYEGMASVTTIDPNLAIIQILIIPDFIQEMQAILESVEKKFELEEITAGN